MASTVVTRTINAPLDTVFKTVSEPQQFSQAVPHITKVEILAAPTTGTGVGTRFRETRVMGGKTAATELEITEHVPNDRVRIVADAHGSVWDSVFSVQPDAGGATRLTLTMDARPYRLLARIMSPLARGFIRKALAQDMDAVKAYCEGAT